MSKQLTPEELEHITFRTLQHYEGSVQSFWEGTKDHDVSQNYEAFLGALPEKSRLRILDFGCGPGRDLLYFKNQGHFVTGLDGCREFCEKAEAYAECPVLHQNFLQLLLPSASFEGIFANASLFHVPGQELARVLSSLREALIPGGVLLM